MLKGKSILVGLTGSIAAYKSIDLIKRLRQEGVSVAVIMTETSKRFITPLSVELAAGGPPYDDLFAAPLSHISLPAEADLLVVAPATANSIAKFTAGSADDMLSATFLAFRGRTIIAPAMNWRMYENRIFQRNLSHLLAAGVKAVGPERGALACGEEGMGRMSSVDTIMEAIISSLTRQDFAGEQVLVTAGPTREYLDPVRYISNRSSGKMGYAVAKVAKRRGAEVTLISGPASQPPPDGVEVIRVETSEDMYRAVMDTIPMASLFIMTAAVADFRPAETRDVKIDKKDKFPLDLVKTTDILAEVGRLKRKPFTVGFSAETGHRIERARKKLLGKDMDMIVFNDVTMKGAGFDVDTNAVIIIDRESERKLPLMSKEEVAMALLDRIREIKGGAGTF
ncbi:MAG: bifunctional phosphopantothenoylcysteine decarboxylase/phosphopantothenate--cysteine ligase CoaBC [Nitrospirales bacterium]|nr:bifunctional phosphopantothenoylcysteine decarboxylase/phosphopantothenate--cysteine ligase CoaBC [Nitrospirales bacterium]